MAPCELERLAARHGGNLGGTAASGVDEDARVEGPARSVHGEASGLARKRCVTRLQWRIRDERVDRLYGRTAHERNTVRRGVFGARDGDVERVDISRRGAPQGAGCLAARAGLKLPDALGADDLKLGNPVGVPVFLEHLEVGTVFLREP